MPRANLLVDRDCIKKYWNKLLVEVLGFVIFCFAGK